jgi:hypothetical protein
MQRDLKPTSACVINFNGESVLSETLDALGGSDPPLAEILVIDNASTDASLDLVRSRFPDVRIVALTENHGPGPARNAGLTAAHSERLLFVDNDVRVQSDTAERLGAALDAFPIAVAAAPRVLFHDRPDTIQYEGADAHFLGLQALRHVGRSDADTPAETVRCGSIVTACFLLDRGRWGAAPAFDETFFFNYEDHDFGVRARIAGHEVLAVGEARVLHGSGTPDLSHRPGRAYASRRVFCLIRNRWQILAKCYSLRTLLVLAPILALYEGFQLVGALRKGWGENWAGAVRWMAGHGPSVRRRRAAVQGDRRTPDREVLSGGPLPFTQDLARPGVERVAQRTLQECAQAYWALARRIL